MERTYRRLLPNLRTFRCNAVENDCNTLLTCLHFICKDVLKFINYKSLELDKIAEALKRRFFRLDLSVISFRKVFQMLVDLIT